MRFQKVTFAALVCAAAAFGQNPITADSPFQVRYAANLIIGESYINIANDGAQGAALQGPGFGTQVGNICANVYAFDPNEELIACCSCLITPDQTVNLGVNANLTSKTLTGVVPGSVTIKLLSTAVATAANGTFNCTNSAAQAGSAAFPIVAGMVAWGTTLHTGPATLPLYGTETAFTPATLSQGPGSELASITGRCQNIIGNGSGFGICSSCRSGALGGSKL